MLDLGLLATLMASAAGATQADAVVELGEGPHLFLDDHLIDKKTDVTFTVHRPEKYSGNPIIPAKNKWTALDKAVAPSTVMADPAGDGLRMWYIPHSRSGLGYHLGYGTSTDGVCWEFPDLGLIDFRGSKHNNLVLLNVIGGRVLFDPHATNPAERYKTVVYRHKPKPVGFSVAFSPDGFRWTPMHWIKELDDSGERSGTGASDVVNIFHDPVRKEFVAVFKMWSRQGDYTVAVKRGTPAPRCGRRILGTSRSKDFRRWSKASVILRPDDKDAKTLEFYGMPAVIRRGGLFIGILPCLIDDAKPDGIGWTELAISRDGDRWRRIRLPFLPRSESKPGAPDHAIAWASEVMTVGNREYVYYTGLEYGHKQGGRFGCVAFLRKDGFASFNAGSRQGRLATKLVRLSSTCRGGMTLNVNASGGAVRVQLSGSGGVLKGYSFSDCDPISADARSVPVTWRGKSELPRTKEPLRIEFTLRDARLYSFGLIP